MNNSTISIKDFKDLILKMKAMEFSVQWRVTSDIGPEWIGSSKTIDFYLDDYVLNETEFITRLKKALSKRVPIPNESKDHVITGEGNISLENNQLKLHYSWEKTIPYSYPSDHKEGKVVLCP